MALASILGGSSGRTTAVKLGRRRGASSSSSRNNGSPFATQQVLYVMVAMTLCASFVVVFWLLPKAMLLSSSSSSSLSHFRATHHRTKPLQEEDNVHNSLALDIITSLKCQEIQSSAVRHNIDDALDDANAPDEENTNYSDNAHRRLAKDDFFNNPNNEQAAVNDNNNVDPMVDDFAVDPLGEGGAAAAVVPEVNAKHFMCLVAGSPNLPSFIRPEAFHCNGGFANNHEQRQALLDIWSSARTQMSLELLESTLSMSQERTVRVLQHDFWLWAPTQDESLDYTQNSINGGNDGGNGNGDDSSLFFDGAVSDRSDDDDNNDLFFMDVGSGLGLTTLAVAKRYPSARILSVEPASPNWLLQSLNLVCNLMNDYDNAADSGSGLGGSRTTNPNFPTVVLAGVGEDDSSGGGSHGAAAGGGGRNAAVAAHHFAALSPHERMAKVLWRPSMTRLTRTWTSKGERQSDDVELVVKLKTLKSILVEYQAMMSTTTDIAAANVRTVRGENAISKQQRHRQPIRILNLDCEGCEYNVVPSMTQSELDTYWTGGIIGTTGVHWGYIPPDKRPSSKRAQTTHERLCHHYDFARQCIECCAFPDLHVKRIGDSVDGHDNDQESKYGGDASTSSTLTVRQVAGDLCDGFADFAERTNLYASNDDYGWMELTSMSDIIGGESA